MPRLVAAVAAAPLLVVVAPRTAPPPVAVPVPIVTAPVHFAPLGQQAML